MTSFLPIRELKEDFSIYFDLTIFIGGIIENYLFLKRKNSNFVIKLE